MKDIKTKTRVDWVKAGLGKGKRFTEKNFLRARWRLLERGLIIIANSAGPAYEKIAAVRQNSPTATLVKAYIAGERWFSIEQIEGAIGGSVFGRPGLTMLANLGLVVMRQVGDRLELTRVDTRMARFVNEARLGPQAKGFGVRALIEGVLSLRHPPSRSIHLTDDRRLLVAERLAEFGIDCDDILGDRKRVRLVSRWLLQRTVAA